MSTEPTDINKVRAATPAGERTVRHLSEMVLSGMDEAEAIRRLDPTFEAWGYSQAERNEYYERQREIIKREQTRPGVFKHALHGVQSSGVVKYLRGKEADAVPEEYQRDMPAHLQAVVGAAAFLPDMPFFALGGAPGFSLSEVVHKGADQRIKQLKDIAKSKRPTMHDSELKRWMDTPAGKAAVQRAEIAASVESDGVPTAEEWRNLGEVAAAGVKGIILDRAMHTAGAVAEKAGEGLLAMGEKKAVKTADEAGKQALARGASRNTQAWHAARQEEAVRALGEKLRQIRPALGAFRTPAEMIALPFASAGMEGRLATGQEVIHNAMVVLGLKGMGMVPHMVAKMGDIHARSGVTPQELGKYLTEHPDALAEMFSADPAVRGQHADILRRGGKNLPTQIMSYLSHKKQREALQQMDINDIDLPDDWLQRGRLQRAYDRKPVEVTDATGKITSDVLDVVMSPEHAMESWIPRDAFTPEQYVQLQSMGLAVDGYVSGHGIRGLISEAYARENRRYVPERPQDLGGRTDMDLLRGEDFLHQLRTTGMAVDAGGAEWQIGREQNGNGYWLGRKSSDKVGPQFLGRRMTFEEAAGLARAFQEGGESVFAWQDKWAAKREMSARMSGAEKMPGSYRETPDGPLLDEQGRMVGGTTPSPELRSGDLRFPPGIEAETSMPSEKSGRKEEPSEAGFSDDIIQNFAELDRTGSITNVAHFPEADWELARALGMTGWEEVRDPETGEVSRIEVMYTDRLWKERDRRREIENKQLEERRRQQEMERPYFEAGEKRLAGMLSPDGLREVRSIKGVAQKRRFLRERLFPEEREALGKMQPEDIIKRYREEMIRLGREKEAEESPERLPEGEAEPESVTDEIYRAMDRLEMAKDLIADLIEAGRDEKEAQAMGLIAAAHAEHWALHLGMTPRDYLREHRARYLRMSQRDFEAAGRIGLEGVYEARARLEALMAQHPDFDLKASDTANRRAIDPLYDAVYGLVDYDSVVRALGDTNKAKELRNRMGPGFFAPKGEGKEIGWLVEQHLRKERGGADVPLEDIEEAIHALMVPTKDYMRQVTAGLPLYQTAYHGTPHRFSRFTLEHIGSGEGHQYHGYGLYFSQGDSYAREYQKRLSRSDKLAAITIGGKRYELRKDLPEGTPKEVAKIVEWFSQRTDNGLPDDFQALRKELLGLLGDNEAATLVSGAEGEYRRGRLVHADIPENDVLLDEQRTFREQPDAVRNALRKLAEDNIEGLVREKDSRVKAAYERAQEAKSGVDNLTEALDLVERGDKTHAWDRLEASYANADEMVERPDIIRSGLEYAREKYEAAQKNYEELLAARKDGVLAEFEELTGGKIYKEISDLLGGDRKASELLNRYGIKGITYENMEEGRSFAIWDAESIKILEELYQGGKDGRKTARGGYLPRREGLNERALIGLFEKADVSTIVHETGHLWLDELEHAVNLGKSELPKEMWRRLQNAYDFDSLDDPAIRTNVHERFARDFEAYLREGKAPSRELQGIFAQFRDWLREIYKTVRALFGEERELPEDVRWVFDRMLASEEELARSPRKTTAPEKEGARRRVGEEPTPTEEDFMAGRTGAERGPEEIPADMRPAGEELPQSPSVTAPSEREPEAATSSGATRHLPQGGRQEDPNVLGMEAGEPDSLRRSAPAPSGREPGVDEPTREQPDVLEMATGSGPSPQPGPPGPPQPPQPMPSADFKPGDAITLDNIATAFSSVLDVPIRLGRFNTKGGRRHGFFKTKENVIRVGKMNEVSTVCHESGHALQKALFERIDPADFQPWAHELSPLSAGLKGDPVLEGFAQFCNFFVTDPAKARQEAPTFYAAFESMMNRKRPDVLGVLYQARAMLEEWKKQPALAQVAGHISFGSEGKESLLTRLRKKETWEDLYSRVVDKLYGLRWAEKQIVGDKKLTPEESPYRLARLHNGVNGKIEHFLYKGTFSHQTHEALHDVNDPHVGEPLAAIMREVDNQALFSSFLVCRRGVKLKEDRGIETGIDLEIMKQGYESGKERYEAIAERLDKYQDAVLQYLVDSKVIDQQAAAKMRALNENYVPFKRLMVDEAGEEPTKSGAGGGGDNLRASNPIRAIHGSSRMIINPLESIVENTELLIEAAEKNKIGRSLVKLAGQYENTGWLVEHIPPHMAKTDLNAEVKRRLLNAAENADPDVQDAIEQFIKSKDLDGVFSFFQASKAIDQAKEMVVYDNGTMQIYRVDRRIAQVMNNLTPESLPVVVRYLNFFTRALRAGATTTIDFMARNLARDTVNTSMISRSGFIPFWDNLVKGLWATLPRLRVDDKGNWHWERTEDYWAWMKAGGSNTHELMRGRQSAQRILAGMQEMSLMERAWNIVTTPSEWWNVLMTPFYAGSEVSEYATRLGEFKKAREKARKEGMDELNAEEQGAYEARDLQDFAVHGSNMRSLMALTAFQGAQIQGLDRGIRGFLEDPKMFLLKGSILAASSAALAYLTHDDDRVMQLDDGQRDMFWCFAVGEDDDYTIYRYPKPFELGVLFASLPERLTHILLDQAKEDKKGYEETPEEQLSSWMMSFWDVTLPNIMPTFATPMIENKTNRKQAFNTPIVPYRAEKLLPEYQMGPWTSPTMQKLSHGLGEMIGRGNTFSPAKAENLITGYFGGWGRQLLRWTDAAMQRAGVVETPPEIAQNLPDWAFVRAFTYTHPGANARDVRRFYNMYGDVEKGLATIGYLRRNSAEGENAAELEALEREFEPYRDVKRVASTLGGILTAMRLVKSEQRLSDKQRETLWGATMQAYGAPGVDNAEVERMERLSRNTNPVQKVGRKKVQEPMSIDLTPEERRDLLELLFKAALQVSREGIVRIRDCKRAFKELERMQKTRPQAVGE